MVKTDLALNLKYMLLKAGWPCTSCRASFALNVLMWKAGWIMPTCHWTSGWSPVLLIACVSQLFSVYNLNMNWSLWGNIYWFCLRVLWTSSLENFKARELLHPNPKAMVAWLLGWCYSWQRVQSCRNLTTTWSDKQNRNLHGYLESRARDVRWLAQGHTARNRWN